MSPIPCLPGSQSSPTSPLCSTACPSASHFPSLLKLLDTVRDQEYLTTAIVPAAPALLQLRLWDLAIWGATLGKFLLPVPDFGLPGDPKETRHGGGTHSPHCCGRYLQWLEQGRSISVGPIPAGELGEGVVGGGGRGGGEMILSTDGKEVGTRVEEFLPALGT